MALQMMQPCKIIHLTVVGDTQATKIQSSYFRAQLSFRNLQVSFSVNSCQPGISTHSMLKCFVYVSGTRGVLSKTVYRVSDSSIPHLARFQQPNSSVYLPIVPETEISILANPGSSPIGACNTVSPRASRTCPLGHVSHISFT